MSSIVARKEEEMKKPILISEPTEAMRDAVIKAEADIAQLTQFAAEAGNVILPDLCMHVAINDPDLRSRPDRIVRKDGIIVAACAFSGFRQIQLRDGNKFGMDPILSKLMTMEHDVPGDMVILTTDKSTAYLGWAMRDFGFKELHAPTGGQQIGVKVEKLMAALKFLRIAPAQRMALTKPYLGQKETPPWLDDNVWAVALGKSLIHLISVKKNEVKTGDMVGSNGRGGYTKTVLTKYGHEVLTKWIEENGDPWTMETL